MTLWLAVMWGWGSPAGSGSGARLSWEILPGLGLTARADSVCGSAGREGKGERGRKKWEHMMREIMGCMSVVLSTCPPTQQQNRKEQKHRDCLPQHRQPGLPAFYKGEKEHKSAKEQLYNMRPETVQSLKGAIVDTRKWLLVYNSFILKVTDIHST